MHRLKRQMGFTLPEIVITLTIMGILAAMAVPSFTGMMERRKLISTAEAIESDLRWARSEAIQRNVNVTVVFTGGSPWSYQIETAVAPIIILKTVNSNAVSEFNGITLAGNNATFDPARGTTNASTVVLTAPAGEVHVVLSILGRARICSVGGKIGDYDAC